MIKRSSKKHIDNLLKENPDWKVLDIGCGYSAHKNASVICDVQDLSNFYKDKNFVRLTDKTLPFKNKEFDFVITSHVLEHVDDIDFLIKELQRVSIKGYIELPTILEDNLVFENKKDHVWHMEFEDNKNELHISKKIQYLEPVITVSSIKKFSKYFRQSLIIELYWGDSIEHKIVEKDSQDFEKISRLSLTRKFFSKLLRNLIR